MWQDPAKRHHFKLHYCECDNHYHILLGPENISWPFWSLAAALKMIDFTQSMFMQDFEKGEIDAAKLEYDEQELDRLRREITLKSRIQKADSSGQFEKGFRMPRDILPHEGNIARFWSSFLLGKSESMCYATEASYGPSIMPLFCDFVHREDKTIPLKMTRKGWHERAMEPVTRMTMEELGIMLDPL